MAQAMGKAVAELAKQQYVVTLVSECGNSIDNEQARLLASWTQSVLMKLEETTEQRR